MDMQCQVIAIPSRRATMLDESQRELVNSLRSTLPGDTDEMTDEDVLRMVENFKSGIRTF